MVEKDEIEETTPKEGGSGDEDDEAKKLIDKDKKKKKEKEKPKPTEEADGMYPWENNYRESKAREENFFWSICLCMCPKIGWL